MFSSDKKKEKQLDNFTLERNRISAKTVLKGDITSDGDFRIDGEVHGDLITTGKVIIGESGKVFGKIKCLCADVEGVFEGRLEVKHELNLKSSAKVTGAVFMESLNVQAGAVFNADCKMVSSVKELNPIRIESSEAKEGNISKIS